ncbi:hypothetical protein F5X98DRAFT_361901 [Xylaria grammica]|nr:hypothetical protein F5X98DRAFT_361901 [Xylaria grammica]
MYSIKVLLAIAALAGTSLSRKSDSGFCSAYMTSLSPIFAGDPTTPPAIVSWLAQKTQTASPTNTTTTPTVTTTPPQVTPNFERHASFLCSIAIELPSSLLPDFQISAAGLLDYGKSHSSDYVAYVTDCVPEDEVAAMTSYLNHVFTATDNLCPPTSTATTFSTILSRFSARISKAAAATRPTGAATMI